MSKVIFIIISGLAAHAFASDLLTYKNKKFGYEVQYPKDWGLYTDEQYDPADGKPPSIEEARSIFFELKNAHGQNKCKYSEECSLGLACHTDGAVEGYERSMKYINESIRRGYIPSVDVRNQEVRINDSKAELIVKDDVDKNRYRIHLLIHCANKSIFSTGGINKYNTMYRSFKDILEKPISIEFLFSEEQAQIINSFKCPAADFVYKPEPKKKK